MVVVISHPTGDRPMPEPVILNLVQNSFGDGYF